MTPILEQSPTVLIPEGMNLGQFLAERITWGSDSLVRMRNVPDDQTYRVAVTLQFELPGAAARDLAELIVDNLRGGR